MPRNTMAFSHARNALVRRSTLSVQARPGRVAFDTVRSRQGRGGEAGRAIYVADSWSHVSFGLTRPHASGATRGGHQIQGLVDPPRKRQTAAVPGRALVELGRITLCPAIERSVVNLHAALTQHLLELAVVDAIAAVGV